MNKKRGVTLDSFLFDDGWDDTNNLWKIRPDFKDGFAPLSNKDGKTYDNFTVNFLKLDAILLPYELKVIEDKPTELHPMPPVPMGKIDSTFIKIAFFANKLGQADQAVLLPAVQSLKIEVVNFLNGNTTT